VGRDAVVDWRVWAPRAKEVRLVLFHGAERTSLPMQAEDSGYHALTVEKIPEGQLYAYQLDEGPPLPGPASLWQPHGIHGPSAVVLPKWFKWSDGDWRGVPRGKLVFYELHVGSFTHEGTFEAIRPRLAALRELGVTAIELMPVAQFPGTRNWGYDGVFPYAVQNSYGGPHGLQRLVDACHAEGLALFLDVVYNHLGPEGNYLAEYGPYFTDRYQTPWGQALNFDGAGSDAVRDYVLDNARMWLEEFHVDGLRLDAVHAIFDLGPRHIVAAIQEVADDVAQRTGRQVHIIAESNRNDPRLLLPAERGGDGLDGQWADDFHHAVHAWLTGERQSYYADFGPARLIAKAFESPFVFAGDYSRYRKRRHGAPAGDLSPDRFVVCLQNHDQVGNRARGERLGTLLCPAKQRLAASLLLLSPYLPLLFMGEEYGETAPFPFYCSFLDSKLVEAVRAGRRREFAHLDGQQVPDPQAVETFAATQLAWSWPEGTAAAGLRRLYGDLLAARRTWPALRDSTQRTARLLPDEDQGVVLELVRSGVESGAEGIHALFNLTGERQPLPIVPAAASQVLLSSESARYLGERSAADGTTSLRPFECLVFGPSSWRAFR
jgi:maltooligosyltrehalose trehalohydrolase